MIIFLKEDWTCMAKRATKSIKGPFSYSPSDADTRAMTAIPAGDYYGSGKRNPMGKMRDSSMNPPSSKKQLGTKPKKIA